MGLLPGALLFSDSCQKRATAVRREGYVSDGAEPTSRVKALTDKSRMPDVPATDLIVGFLHISSESALNRRTSDRQYLSKKMA